MNRIGGPSAVAPLAHVQLQAAAARHRVGLHPPGRFGRRRHFRPPRVRRADSDRRRRRSRCASGAAPYLPRPGALSAATGCLRAPSALVAAARYWPRGASRQGVRGPRRRARDARARARRRAGGPRRGHPRGRRGGIGKTRLAAEIAGRARDGGFADPARPVDRSRRDRAALPAVRRGPAPARRTAARRRQRVPSCGSSRRRWRCSPITRPPRRCCSCSRTCTGPTRQRSTWSSSSPTTWPNDRWCCSPPIAADEPSSKGRMARLADGVRRSGSGLVLDLGPLPPEDLTALLAPAPDARLAPALADAIVARSAGNPFFAEELLAAAREPDRRAPAPPARPAAAAGGTARRRGPGPAAAGGRRRARRRLPAAPRARRGPRARRARGAAPGRRARGPRRRPGRGHLPVPPPAAGRSRLLDDPPRRARGAARPARRGAVAHRGRPPAELAPHWAAAGRAAEALAASVEAARQAEAVFGLAEAVAHLERALALWPAVPDAAGLDRARPGRALLLGGRDSPARPAPRPVRPNSPGAPSSSPGTRTRPRAALLHVRLGVYPYANGSNDAGLAAFERAVELAPPPSAERAQALAAFGTGLHMAWRHRGVTRGLRAGARARAGDRGASGRAAGAHRARQRPRLPRPRRGGPGPARPGRAARRGNRRSDGPAAGVHHPHRRADHARPARGVGPGGRRGARGRPPLRRRYHGAGGQPGRGAAGRRRLG